MFLTIGNTPLYTQLAPQTVQKGRFEVTSTDYSNIKKSESQVSNKGGGDGSRSGYGGGGQAWAASYPKNVLEQHQVLLDYLCSQSQQHTWMLQSLMQKLGVEGVFENPNPPMRGRPPSVKRVLGCLEFFSLFPHFLLFPEGDRQP